MKVLVVDDEPLVRLSIKRASEARGHQVIVASDGMEGVDLWRKHQPELVFLDVLMPGLSGPQVLKEMGGSHLAKTVLISAYTGEYDLKRAQSIGADLFIPKPFEDIFEVIEAGERLVNGG